MGGWGADYMLKDHLGNVRVVLTDEKQTSAYPVASMEPAQNTTESTYYGNISTTRIVKPAGYPVDNYTNPNDYVAKVRGDGNKIGPSIILKVMAGDKFNVRANSWYKLNGVSPSGPNPLTELADALANGVAGLAGNKATSAQLLSSGVSGGAATNFLNTQAGYTIGSGKPKAYLSWVLMDEQFRVAKDAAGNIIASGYSGFDQVGNSEEFKLHQFTDRPINESGYLYIYVSNETPNIDSLSR